MKFAKFLGVGITLWLVTDLLGQNSTIIGVTGAAPTTSSASATVGYGGVQDGQDGGSGSSSSPEDDVSGDADGDGLPDSWEHRNGTDPSKADDTDDYDSDGLTNAEEREYGTYPRNPDSDGDSVQDGLDGWALEPHLTHPRFFTTKFAVIDLVEAGFDPDYDPMQIDGKGNVAAIKITDTEIDGKFFQIESGDSANIPVWSASATEVDSRIAYDILVSKISRFTGTNLVDESGVVIGNAVVSNGRADELRAAKWKQGAGMTILAYFDEMPPDMAAYDFWTEILCISENGGKMAGYGNSRAVSHPYPVENYRAEGGMLFGPTGYSKVGPIRSDATTGTTVHPMAVTSDGIVFGKEESIGEQQLWRSVRAVGQTVTPLGEFTPSFYPPPYVITVSDGPKGIALGHREGGAVYLSREFGWSEHVLRYIPAGQYSPVKIPDYAFKVNSNGQMLALFGATSKLLVNGKEVKIDGHPNLIPFDINEAGMVLGDSEGKPVLLVPFGVLSDLNNDGKIGDADQTIKSDGAKSGATDQQKEKATEYLFANDTLSNGAWDKEDKDPLKPQDRKDDDDAEELTLVCAATWGAVWFDHPAIAKLAFYKTKECLPADKVTFPFTLSESNKLPEKLYVRAEGEFTTEVDGDLVMRFGKADQSETWAEDKLKFSIISQIGDAKYFNAARDYMMETNSRVHVRIFKSGSQQIRITAMRHEATTMGVVETYNRPSKIYGLPGVVAAANDGYDLILNGNFCYFEGGYAGRIWGMANHQMTSRCHGGCVVNGVQNPATSEGGTHSLEQANAEYLSSNGKGTFAITTGIVPLPPSNQYALGGFASNLVGGLYATHPWFGIAETGPTGDRKKYIFTVTQTAPTTSYPLEDLVQRLTTSGQTICVAGDGGSSTAIAYRTEGANTRVGYAGDKHYPGHYWINTYIGFLSDKPRQ